MGCKTESFWLKGLHKPVGCGFYLLDVGRLLTSAGEIFQFGGHNSWHVVSAGQGYVKCNGSIYYLKRGDMFAVMHDNNIEYGPVKGENWEFYYLRIEGKDADKLNFRIGMKAERPILRGDWGEQVLRCFHNLWQLAQNNNSIPETYASGILQIVECLCKGHQVSKRTPEEIVTEAMQIIRNPLNRHINVNEMASALNISRVSLFKAFKEQTGNSPLHHLQEFRIREGCRLLRENQDMSIADICKYSAFPNDKYFIRIFKRFTGLTPGEYRKQATADK